MKDKLISLLKAKESLNSVQSEFKKSLLERYPVLMIQDISDMRKNINGELELLLSSCTRTASTRIVIPWKGSYKKEVILTRKPGLKQPHECYAAFGLDTIGSIDGEGNILISDEDNEDVEKKKVHLSVLKTSGQILQDRLDQFYLFLEESIMLMKRLSDFCPGRYWNDENLPRVKAGNHRIKLQSCGFELEIYNENAKKAYDKFENIDATHILNYERDSWDEKTGSISMQNSLMTFVRDFELIDGVLKETEYRKKELIKSGNDLKDRLLEYNKPYKVLRKLLTKD